MRLVLAVALALLGAPALSEPFEITARLLHCHSHCVFLSNGTRYLAPVGTPMMKGLIASVVEETMKGVRPTHLTHLSGEIQKSTELTFWITVTDLERLAPDGTEPLRAQLEGFWNGRSRSTPMLLITGGSLLIWRRGTEYTEAVFDLTDRCTNGEAPAIEVVEFSELDPVTTCWVIRKISERTLHLWHPGTNKDLRFLKEQPRLASRTRGR